MIEVSERKTPVGEVRVAVRGDTLVGLGFLDGWSRVERHLLREFLEEELRETKGQAEVGSRLDAYMKGQLGALAGIAVDTGGTSFQRRVWSAISDVPAGQTRSYAELAAAAGARSAVRAAGTACGANPIGLVIPCHRIVRADGDPGNYGGGVERKEWLLAHERRHSR
ncbi:MAG: methylated-DNA--[protein]-cysteine S-methyltransferase [Actinobacteria bacterium]|nr:MAG: methylated-DNA--[protein]-cysteine S-methyltransferase [Actinomycetota bacterium]